MGLESQARWLVPGQTDWRAPRQRALEQLQRVATDVRASLTLQRPIDEATGQRTLCVMSAIDNLIKGGAGQAVQSFNLMIGADAGFVATGMLAPDRGAIRFRGQDITGKPTLGALLDQLRGDGAGDAEDDGLGGGHGDQS